MCRFLLAQSPNPIESQTLLEAFARMARKSKALDGDWQGDGWGAAWTGEDNAWQGQTSLKPIWEDSAQFSHIPKTHQLVIHARSASFPHQKEIIAYNQPFIDGQHAFVFNGLLKGVALPGIPGDIGAQKIWYLLRKELADHEPREALENVKQLLLSHAREIVALNIGLATTRDIFSLCYFTQHPEYYQLQSYHQGDISIISSEKV